MTENYNKYSSIECSYREEFIKRIKNNGYADIPYAISEKVHGTNVQVRFNLMHSEDGCTNILGPVLGTKNDELNSSESCFNFKRIIENMDLLRVVGGMTATIIEDPRVEFIIFYGELFGGTYPHPSIPKDENSKRVQKGVFYSPDNNILFFDIAIKYIDKQEISYLPYAEFERICEEYAIPYIKACYIANNLDEALQYPNDEPSQIYKLYGLPEIEDNIREGVVIRPMHVSPFIGSPRLIIKNKNKKFSEKSHQKKRILDMPNTETVLPENIIEIINSVLEYVTENRVANIVSHFGEVSIKQMTEVIKETIKDVFDDFSKDNNVFNSLEKTEIKVVKTKVGKVISDLVREYMFKNC